MPESKAQLRKTLRRRRNALSAGEQLAASQQVSRRVAELDHWNSAISIALYQSADGEVDTASLQALASRQGKRVYLPIIGPQSELSFGLCSTDRALIENQFGILEPPAQAPRSPVATLDIIFLPLVGWDRSGGRLGMGGGYYDRALERSDGALKVGLAHSGQELKQVPREDWDIDLDVVVTERGVYWAPLAS